MCSVSKKNPTWFNSTFCSFPIAEQAKLNNLLVGNQSILQAQAPGPAFSMTFNQSALKDAAQAPPPRFHFLVPRADGVTYSLGPGFSPFPPFLAGARWLAAAARLPGRRGTLRGDWVRMRSRSRGLSSSAMKVNNLATLGQGGRPGPLALHHF